MRKICCFLLSLLLLLPVLAMAESDEDELYIEEFLEGDEGYNNDNWTFPVALQDMDPQFLILVNNHYLVGSKYVCSPLVKIKYLTLNKDGSKKNGDMYLYKKNTTMKLNETCAEALIALSDAAREDGYNLYLKSAYRTYGQQASIYSKHLKNGKPDGWAVKAGGSDHQTGLGCDVVPKSWRSKPMNSKMAKEPECQWMAEHCAEYGFIIRYPEGKEEITEVNYEPWHLRYVGVPAATYIMENGLCLEEFNDLLQEAIADYLARGGDPAKVEAFIQVPSDETTSGD